MTCFRRKKIPQMREEIDKISSLPDPIRSKIVSYLPTLEALRTSILSKQWRYLYHSLSNLDFDESEMGFRLVNFTSVEFKAFVNKVLSCHDGTDIESFRLHHTVVGHAISAEDIYPWISFGLDHNFRKFELLGIKCINPYDHQLELPPSIFTCSTLSILSLASINLVLPTVFCLPLLKKLSLDYVLFSAPSENILSCRCPLLEKLVVKDSTADEINDLTISVPCSSAFMFLKISDSNVHLEINLSIPNLSKLKFTADKPPIITSETLSSLNHADFKLCSSPPSDELVDYYMSASCIVRGLHNVCTLILNVFFLQFLSRNQDTLAYFPTYRSLKLLFLELYPTIDQVLLVISLLNSMPNLRFLQIMEVMIDDCILDVKNKKRLAQSRLCTGQKLKCLREVCIYSFNGSESELELVRYLLQNAITLKQMSISYSLANEISIESFNRISRKVMRFTRGSPCVVIKQYHSSTHPRRR